jgi:ketosteroid isomerase-like protein
MSIKQEQVLDFLNKWRAAYEKGDPSFFDFFAQDASLFPISSPTRIDSLEEYRRVFESELTRGVSRKVQLMSPEIRVMGDVALVSAHQRIFQDGSRFNFRFSAVVLQDAKGNLKVAHMHFSPLTGSTLPAAAAMGISAAAFSSARNIEEITLLEERVATAAAMTGTPK